MSRILFLGTCNAGRSQMAAAFAAARRRPSVDVRSAGLRAGDMHPMTLRVMGELGINLSPVKPLTLHDLGGETFDVVVTLSREAAGACPLLAGKPQVVHWHVADPDGVKGEEATVLATFRQCRDEIARLVSDFFDRGYLDALISARHCESVLLDNISDGILAHDMECRIFCFNRAAQEITGYAASEVMSRICSDVFPGRFCGGKCLSQNGTVPEFEQEEREIEIATRAGEKRVLHTSLRPLREPDGRMIGVILSFRDLTRERHLARRVGEVYSFAGIIGRDEKMIEIYDLIRDLANTDVPVLIQGESGTGKELVAAAIHNEGQRRKRQFVPVNCGALPESLLESELFGHVKGAFTGAIRDKKGRFELADGGTIFLDEIGDISPAMQVKLMRVVQEGTFERVGSEETIRVDVRIISATNKDLSREIAVGHFRDDLYYRLSVVPLWLPALRERRADIPLIAEHILRRVAAEADRGDVSLSPEAMDVVMSYDWPGNVRELQNWMRFALVKCKQSTILPQHLPPPAGDAIRAHHGLRRRRKLDAESVRAALRETDGNKVEAARVLGVSRATLYRFLTEIGEMN